MMMSTIISTNRNEDDQLNQINLQALQNRDPYITKIIDQAQRVCVYKFIAEKREWERKELEGTLFVYERTCEPYHGFVILSTVSRETFVQIIKSSMEFKHSPNYEAFLQYKVDVGEIYGIWFISTNDCPRVTECLINLTIKVKESEQSKEIQFNNPSDIFCLLTNAQEKFQESKRKQDNENSSAMPSALLRLFSIQDNPSQSINNDEREQELKKTLGILGKPALSVTELEKQFLQPLSINNSVSSCALTNAIQDWTTSNQNLLNGISPSNHQIQFESNGHLMTPAEFQTFRIPQSPVLIAPVQINSTSSCSHCQNNRLSKDTLRQLLMDMLQNDEEFLTGLHNAYTEKQNGLRRIYS
jgi:transcriptional regulator of met regulon